MPRKKSTKKKAVKKVVKKTVKRERVKAAPAPTSYRQSFNEEWEDGERDMIHGLYGSEEHNLGTTHVHYSGLPTLDRKLGVKRDTDVYGLPLNKIIEVFGKEQSGKCRVKDSRVLTSRGIRTVEELFNDNGFVPSCTNKEKKISVDLINRYGNEEGTSYFVCNGRKKVFKTVTNSGFEIETTPNHKHLIMNERGNWVWKNTADLVEGDVLCSPRHQGAFGVGEISSGEAYFLGVCIADAHLGKIRIAITNDDPQVKACLERTAPRILGIEPKVYGKGKSADYRFSSKTNVQAFYEKFGLVPCVSKEKKITKVIRNFDKAAMSSFLKGYFDCECHINKKKKAIEVTSASYDLLRDIKLILQLQYGIVSYLADKPVKAYPQNQYWRLNLYGYDAFLYCQRIGFSSRKRLLDAESLRTFDLGQTASLKVPNVYGLLRDAVDSMESNRGTYALFCDHLSKKTEPSYDKLERIMGVLDASAMQYRLQEICRKNYFYDRIASIEDMGSKPTFGFECPQTNSLIADGIITHNSTLGKYLCASVIKAGGLAYFVDFEHKYDPAWMRRIGAMNGVSEDKLKDGFRYVDPPHMQAFIKWLIRFMKRTITAKTTARTEIARLLKLKKPPDDLKQLLKVQHAIVAMPSIVVVDSIAAIYTESEKKKDAKGKINEEEVKVQVAEVPNIFNRCLKNIRCYLGYTKTTIIFINQIRDNIETNQFLAKRASKIKTPCGNAVKHFSDGRIQISRIMNVYIQKNGVKRVAGGRYVAKVVKNQMGVPPFQECELTMLNRVGFVSLLSVLDALVEAKKVAKKGNVYAFKYQGAVIQVQEGDVENIILDHPEYEIAMHKAYVDYMIGK